MLLLNTGRPMQELREIAPVPAPVAQQIPDRLPGKTPQPPLPAIRSLSLTGDYT
jgi:hypothetical protein